MGYITDLNACTDPTSGDYLLIADASAGASDRDRKVDVSEFALTEATNSFTLAQVMPSVRTGVTGSVADDGVFSFTPVKTRGLLFLSTNGVAGMPTILGIVSFDCVGAGGCSALAVGSNLNVTSGALTGTTGTNGKATASSHSDGKIYIENRIGYTVNWSYFII